MVTRRKLVTYYYVTLLSLFLITRCFLGRNRNDDMYNYDEVINQITVLQEENSYKKEYIDELQNFINKELYPDTKDANSDGKDANMIG